MNARTVALLTDARAAILRNAEQLLEDARCLLLDKRAARGFALQNPQ